MFGPHQLCSAGRLRGRRSTVVIQRIGFRSEYLAFAVQFRGQTRRGCDAVAADSGCADPTWKEDWKNAVQGRIS